MGKLVIIGTVSGTVWCFAKSENAEKAGERDAEQTYVVTLASMLTPRLTANQAKLTGLIRWLQTAHKHGDMQYPHTTRSHR